MKTLLSFLILSATLFFSCKKAETPEILRVTDYSGSYTATGYFYHPSYSRDISMPKTLTFFSENAVACAIGDLGFATGDSAWYVILQIDPATNALSITHYPGMVNGPNAITLFSSGLPATTAYTPQWPQSDICNNTYDPGTGEFRIRYGYTEGSGLRVIEEVLRKNL